MSRRIHFAVITLIILLVSGLVTILINRVRNAASLVQCGNNLKQIGIAFHNYHDQYGHFPIGTVSNPDLLPEKRLSWTVQVWPAYLCGGTASLINKTKPWDAEENCPPRWSICISANCNEMREEPMGQVRIFLCPAVPVQPTPSLPAQLTLWESLVWAMTQLNCHCPTLEPGSSETTVRCHARTSKTAWLRPWWLLRLWMEGRGQLGAGPPCADYRRTNPTWAREDNF